MYLIKLYDVRMSHDLQDVNLSSHALHIGLILDFVLLKDLDSHLLPGEYVSA